jgi:hypothetical protein
MLNAVLLLLAGQAGSVPASPPAPPPSLPCATAPFSAFDFWVGDWDVYPTGKDSQIARSKIEKLYAGCAIRENWMPLKGTGGGSLNTIDPATGRWRQFWVDSSGGGAVEFVGGPVAGKMVLTGFWRGVGGPGKDGIVRMTYTALDQSTVRQHGEVSTDQGLTWSTSFDFTYRRTKSG